LYFSLRRRREEAEKNGKNQNQLSFSYLFQQQKHLHSLSVTNAQRIDQNDRNPLSSSLCTRQPEDQFFENHCEKISSRQN